MIKTTKYIFKGAVLLLLFYFPEVQAQNQESVTTDSVKTAFFPALSYKSDLGFIGGGLLQRFHYKEEIEPFYSLNRIVGVASTKGLLSFYIERDKPQAFGTKNRLSTVFILSRFLRNNYFGIGNYQKIDDSFNASTDLYSFNSFSVGANAELRIPVRKSSQNNLDALAIINFDYQTPFDNNASNLITQEQPLGVQGGRTLNIGTGFIWENRNDEFRPTAGNYVESNFEAGQTWWGSSFNSYIFRFDARQYFSFNLFKKVTWANRLYTKQTAGDTPYWKLAFAGNEETMRGYPLRRFLDDNVVLLNTELRTWLFKIDAIEGEFGGTIFFDIGRTYPNGISFSDFTSDIKFSGGIGGTSSFFTPDFIFRTDIGFSEEGIGIYFTSGYMF